MKTTTRRPAPAAPSSVSAPPRPASRNAAPAPVSRKAAQKIADRHAPRVKVVTGRPVKTTPTTRGRVKAKVARVRPPLELTPVRNVMNKTELLQYIVDQVGLEHVTVRDMKKIYEVLVETILGSLAPKGAGEFVLPGIVKFMNVKKPATKGGKKATSPFTGEEYITKAKPATIKVKARTLSMVKRAATGQ